MSGIPVEVVVVDEGTPVRAGTLDSLRYGVITRS